MADLGRWFKLWISALNDTDLDNLPIADFGRWAKLGAFVKEQGKDGVLHISPPAKGLCAKLQLDTYEEAVLCIASLPNVRVDRGVLNSVIGVTDATVTFLNWNKYQGDNSFDRVRKFRNRVTIMKQKRDKTRKPHMFKDLIIKDLKEKEKDIYGELKNVLLSKPEYDKLKERFGEKTTLDWIVALDLWLAKPQNKKKVTNHYATVLSWDRNEKKKQGAINVGPRKDDWKY